MFAFSSKSEGYASDIAYSTTLFSVQCSLSPRKSRQKSGGGFALARKPRQKSGGLPSHGGTNSFFICFVIINFRYDKTSACFAIFGFDCRKTTACFARISFDYDRASACFGIFSFDYRKTTACFGIFGFDYRKTNGCYSLGGPYGPKLMSASLREGRACRVREVLSCVGVYVKVG